MKERSRSNLRPPRVQPVVVMSIVLAVSGTAGAGSPGFGLGLEEAVPFGDVLPWGEGPDPSRRQEPIDLFPQPWVEPSPAFPARLPSDFVALAIAPLEWEGRNWRQLGLGVVAVGAVALLDDEINGWILRHRSEDAVRIAEKIRPLGQEGALLLLGATWVAGRHFDRPQLTAVAEDGLESALFAAGVITPLLKAVTGRVRPRHADQSGEFDGSSHSFPSGETTMAFAIASVIAAHSHKWWVDAVAWGAAGVIGAERMVLDAHWASDVVAGALIGTAVGRWVVRRNRPELSGGPRLAIAPIVGAQTYGVSVHLRF